MARLVDLNWGAMAFVIPVACFVYLLLLSAPDGSKFRRLASAAFNLEDPAQVARFLEGEAREITIPGGRKKIAYDLLQRIGVGVSRLGTSEAIAIGACAFALHQLDQ
jgi:glucokinase